MKKILSRIKILFISLYSYTYDYLRFVCNAYLYDHHDKHMGRGHLLRVSHALEKGMSLSHPRQGFGAEKAIELLSFMEQHVGEFGIDHESKIAVATIQSYLKYQEERGFSNELLIKLAASLASFLRLHPPFEDGDVPRAGLRSMTLKEVLNTLPSDPEGFFFSRQSIRQFKPCTPISDEILERAARMAQRSPSVCNRQSNRLRVYTDPKQIAETLKFQDGNSGFGADCGALAVITSDITQVSTY